MEASIKQQFMVLFVNYVSAVKIYTKCKLTPQAMMRLSVSWEIR